MIESNINQIIKGLNDLDKKQIPYATMVATNNIAFDYLDKQKKEVESKLNWTKRPPNIIRISKATKKRPYAKVFINEEKKLWGYYAVQQHFKGGDRHRKGMEKEMIRLKYMYKWEILTPPPGIKIKPSTYVQMMSQLKLFKEVGSTMNETKKSRYRKLKSKTPLRFFIVTGKSKSPLAPGVYAKMNGHNKPICMLRISEKPEYKKRFDMERTLRKVIRRRGQEHLSKALAHAFATAK